MAADAERGVLRGRYRLERVLGQGGMARTWLAVDQEREQALWAAGSFPEDLDADGVPDAARVAIKELPLSRLREWKDLALFEKEARVLGELDHPDIPRHVESFLEQEEGGSTFYLIEEWIDGVSLKQSLDQGEVFSEARARELLWQIAPILHYLHDRAPPVVHRDIKPSNLIVRRDGRVALIDFGAVREVKGGDESGPLSTVVGTFGYMAPEQLHGRALPTSDMYSLGVTVCQLLCRRDPSEMPVKGRPFAVDFRAHCKVSAGFGALLDEMLEPDPDERLPDAQALLRALDELDGGPRAPAVGREADEVGPQEPQEALVAQRQPRGLEPAQRLYAFWDLPSRTGYVGVGLALLLTPSVLPMLLLMLWFGPRAVRSFQEGKRNQELLRRGTLLEGEVVQLRPAMGGRCVLRYKYVAHRQSFEAALEVKRRLVEGLAPGDPLWVAVDPYQPQDSVPLLGRVAR